MSKRTMFVGDVHGCYMELKGLLQMANYKPDSERLFFSRRLDQPWAETP